MTSFDRVQVTLGSKLPFEPLYKVTTKKAEERG